MYKPLLLEPSSSLHCVLVFFGSVVTFSPQTFSFKSGDERFTTELSCFVSATSQKSGQHWPCIHQRDGSLCYCLAAWPVWLECERDWGEGMLVFRGPWVGLWHSLELHLLSFTCWPLNTHQMWGLGLLMLSSWRVLCKKRAQESQISLILAKHGTAC